MTKIKIFLNGESREIPEKISVKQLFTFLELSDKHCAVEVNKEIIFKSIWNERELLKEDRVEIVRAIGGG
jgi:thiamine biosynthesis protein ThiS